MLQDMNCRVFPAGGCSSTPLSGLHRHALNAAALQDRAGQLRTRRGSPQPLASAEPLLPLPRPCLYSPSPAVAIVVAQTLLFLTALCSCALRHVCPTINHGKPQRVSFAAALLWGHLPRPAFAGAYDSKSCRCEAAGRGVCVSVRVPPAPLRCRFGKRSLSLPPARRTAP